MQDDQRLRDEIARIIRDAREMTYRISLTRLVDGVSTYSLFVQGTPPEEFEDYDSASSRLQQIRDHFTAGQIIALFEPETT